MLALSKNNCALEGRLLRPWSLLWLCGRVKCSGIVLQKCISALGNTECIHTTTVTILWVKNAPMHARKKLSLLMLLPRVSEKTETHVE